jgi:tetratricopeptide (TPR) repeat protein
MTRIAALAALVLVLSMNRAGAQGGPLNLAAILDTYFQGQHDAAVASAAALPDLGPLRLRFVQDAPQWANADPARAEARRAAAAAFIVELAAARLETDWGRLSDLIEYTCAQVLRASGPPTSFERSWHMATTALAGRARARLWMLGEYARLPHQKPVKRPPSKEPNAPPAHLMHALERFPDDPQFQLARVIAWTWGRDQEPIRNTRPRERDDFRQGMSSLQEDALTALEPLTSVPAIAPEALIRAGLVHVSAGNHGGALHAFERAQPLASETPLKYLAHFLTGRALEALDRHDEAVGQYRRALDIVPGAESAVVALASLQFLHNDREAAVALIDQTFAKPAATTDPGRMTGYGYFLRWPAIKAAMRAELER